MADESEASKPWAEATRNALQSHDSPLITKPKLTDKLLERPPFKFLHDVVTRVQEATGFAPDLFTDSETDRESVTDKQSKIQWLLKLKRCIELATGESLHAKPEKIVAGKEAQLTNELLQALARAARMGPCSNAVQQTLHELSDASESSKQTPTQAETSATQQLHAQHHTAASEKQRQPDTTHDEDASSTSAAGGDVVGERDATAYATSETVASDQQHTGASSSEQQQQQQADEDKYPVASAEKQKQEPEVEAKVAVQEEEEEDRAAHQLATSRPRSAHKAPPRPPSSRGRGAQQHHGAHELQNKQQEFAGTLIGEHSRDDAARAKDVDNGDDDGDVVLTDEAELVASGSKSQTHEKESGGGKLVQDIQAATEKALATGEDGSAENDALHQHQHQQDSGSVEQQQGIVLKRRGRRSHQQAQQATQQAQEQRYASAEQAAGEDISRVKDAVQKLVRVCKPFGQAVEQLNEDAEAIDREYEQWQKERERAEAENGAAAATATSRSDHASYVDAGTNDEEIKSLNQAIQEERDALRAAKARSIRNEKRIAELLRVVISPAATATTSGT